MTDVKFLQLFADAGTTMNGTTAMINAYTGATTARTATENMSQELKDFYDTELLENVRIQQFYAQFAKKQPLPAHHGGKVEWRKWNTFAKAGKLEEGVIPTAQKFGMTAVYGDINQYGTFATFTDKLELRAYDDVILGATEEMGASAAETQETLVRDFLYTGSNVLYCDNIDAGTGAFVNTPAGTYGMKNESTAFSLLTPTMVNKAVTKMKKDRVPMINGKYYAVIHPSVAYDLRQSDEWIDVHKYAAPEEIFNGEIGELHGVRFIENTFAPVLVGPSVNGDTANFLSVTGDACATGQTAGTACTGTDSAGVTGTAYIVVNEAIKGPDLVGRTLNVLDAIGATGASAVVNAQINVCGVDAPNKRIYFDQDEIINAIAAGDFVVAGEGGLEYKGGDQNAAYATYFFGKDGFGIIDPEGGALQMIIHDKDEIGGPLNQFSTVGYKFETGAAWLYDLRVLRVMSCSAYSKTDDKN